MLPDSRPLPAVACWQGDAVCTLATTQARAGPPGPWLSPASERAAPPPPYLSQVLGDAAPAVGVGDLGVLQVHNPLAHILVEQDGPVVTSCGGRTANR